MRIQFVTASGFSTHTYHQAFNLLYNTLHLSHALRMIHSPVDCPTLRKFLCSTYNSMGKAFALGKDFPFQSITLLWWCTTPPSSQPTSFACPHTHTPPLEIRCMFNCEFLHGSGDFLETVLNNNLRQRNEKKKKTQNKSNKRIFKHFSFSIVNFKSSICFLTLNSKTTNHHRQRQRLAVIIAGRIRQRTSKKLQFLTHRRIWY